jgi:N-methylhydantoinase B
MNANLDPVTFEVMRHRFSSIAEEGALVLRNVSGSPSVAHSNDCNVALLTATGEGVAIGPNIVSHALSCIHTVRYVLKEYSENPGIESGDMFITNHPYISTPHQTCVVVVAPIHREGKIIAWAGAGIHVADVGGPVPGQISVGAQSIWEEALPMAPLKIVERGKIRKDIEQEYLLRSRTRIQNSIDLRAKIAANHTVRERIVEMATYYGVETVQAAMEQALQYSETKLVGILESLPDGSWYHSHTLDYYDQDRSQTFVCRLKMTKQSGKLIFDFRGSSPQAGGVINATHVALQSSVVRMLLALFGYSIGLCPGAVLRVMRIESDAGTFVDCAWPAGACKGTTAATYSIMAATAACLSKMLAASEPLSQRAAAPFKGHMEIAEIVGTDQRGHSFGTVFIDGSLAQGNGALSAKDGIDTGGGMDPAVSIPNVETNEFRYPILYLYRREVSDTGGPGSFRGGVGLATAITPHDVERIPNVTFHGHGVEFPTADGLFGGYPGSTNQIRIKRRSNLGELFAQGSLPRNIDELDGVDEVPKPISRSFLDHGDVCHFGSCGGGGYGDPIERHPEKVAGDVASGLVSREWAEQLYAVCFEPLSSRVNLVATEKRRKAVRHARQRSSSRSRAFSPSGLPRFFGALLRVNANLSIVQSDDGAIFRCRCGELLARAEENYKEYLAWAEMPCSAAGPYTTAAPEYVLREFYCPACYALLEVDVVEKGQAISKEVELKLS